MLHAAVVHFPIVLAMLGVPLLVLCGIFYKNTTLRVLAAGLYLALVASAYVAVETGEEANRKVPANISAEASAERDEHHDLAERVVWLGAITFVFCLLSLLPFAEFRAAMLLLAVVMGIVTALNVAFTAHHGGNLVYKHGIGRPEPTAPAASAMPAPALATTATPTTPEVTEAPAAEPLVPIRPIDLVAAEAVSYVRDVRPIMEDKCIDCHEGDESDGNWDASTVATMTKAGDKGGPGIIPGDPDNSSIVQYIRGEKLPRMPRKKAALSEDVLHVIRLWIAAGAVDDSLEPAPVMAPAQANSAAIESAS